MECLIRARALLINEEEGGANDIAEIEDEEEGGSIGEEDGGVDAETDQW